MPERARLLLLSCLVAILTTALWIRFAPPARRSPAAGLILRSESQQRGTFGAGVRLILNARGYARIEALAETLRAGAYQYPSGVPQLHVFYVKGFGEVTEAQDVEHWERHLDRIREWNDARPGSNVARLALAHALIGRAWAARGRGWARDVSGGQWRRFDDDIDEAGRILRQCPDDARSDPEWWEATLQVLHAQGGMRDSAYRSTSLAAVESFPDQWHLYNEMAIHLMPRWYGGPGDWQRYAERRARALPQPLGDEVYARILVSQCRFVPDVFHEDGAVSWERARRGLVTWHERCPESIQPRSALALFAWQTGHPEEARRAFGQLGDTVEVDVWRDPARFLEARAWAVGKTGFAASFGAR